jgi:phage anti-repressor protein
MRTEEEIRAMIYVLEATGYSVARDMAKVLDWVLGNEPSNLLEYYMAEAKRMADQPDTKGR